MLPFEKSQEPIRGTGLASTASAVLTGTGYSGGQMLQLISSAITSMASEERPLKADNATVGSYFSQLALRYAEQGRWDEAERLYTQALEVIKQNPSESHRALDRNLEELASFYAQRGKYSEAEPLLEKVAEIRWRELSPDNELFIHSLSNLATVY